VPVAFSKGQRRYPVRPGWQCHRLRLRRLVEDGFGRGLVPGGVTRPIALGRGRTAGPRPSTASRSARGRALKSAMNASTASGSSSRTPSAVAVVQRCFPKLKSGHVASEVRLDHFQMPEEHVDRLAVGIEKIGLSQEG
jgi:hypothetical protein